MSKQERIEIIYLPISEIREYENNPRQNERAIPATARSIKRYGIRTPAIIDKNNVLLAGHTRIKAAISLGYTEFPCVRADSLSENEGKAFRLADNRAQEDSAWDTEALAAEFSDLKENGFDLADTGFDEFEIGGIDLSAADFQRDESGEIDTDGESYSEDEVDDEESDEETESVAGDFVCIVSCNGAEEKARLAEIIGETEELKTRYTVEEIKELFAMR